MKTALLLALLISFSGCCQPSESRHWGAVGGVSEQRAVELAKQKFSELYPGRLTEYKVSISGDLCKEAWYVLFTGTGKYAKPGGYTPIMVDKATGAIRVVGSD